MLLYRTGSDNMGPLLFYLGSILETFTFNYLNQNRLYLDVGKAGYKIIIEDDESLLQLTFLVKFIPLINLGYVLYHIINYNLNRNEIIEYLRNNHLIEPLTKGELDLYQKNEDIITLRDLAARYYYQRKYPYMITFVSDKDISRINYAFDLGSKEVIILEVVGILSNLSLEEQKILVTATVKMYEEIYIRKYGSRAKYYYAIDEGYLNPGNIVTLMPDVLEENLSQKLNLFFKN